MIERKRRHELHHLRRVRVQKRLRAHGRRQAGGLEDEVRHRSGFGQVALEAVDLEERDAPELDRLPHLAHEARLAHAAPSGDEEAGVLLALQARVDGALYVLELALPADEGAREEVVLTRVPRLELVREGAGAVDEVEKLAGARRTSGGLDGAEPFDDVGEPRRDALRVRGIETHGLGHLLLQQGVEALRRAVRRLAGQQLVRHDAETVEIGPVVTFPRARDLGRDVVGSAHHEPADAAQAREAEVDDLHLALSAARADDDVAGLQVEVDDAAAVEVRERADHRHEEVERFLPGNDPSGRRPGRVRRGARRRDGRGAGVDRLLFGDRLGGQEAVERRAGQELHREEERVDARHLLEVVNARDVRVPERRHRLELGAKQRDRVPERVEKDLERRRTARKELVVDAVHPAHSPAREEAVDAVAAVDDEARLDERIRRPAGLARARAARSARRVQRRFSVVGGTFGARVPSLDCDSGSVKGRAIRPVQPPRSNAAAVSRKALTSSFRAAEEA